MPPSAVTAEAVAAAAVAADAAAAARDATAAAHDELDTVAEEPAAVTTVAEPATEPPVAALASVTLDAAPTDLAAQAQFFKKHIEPWAPLLMQDIEAAKSAVFYAPVGTIGRAFMDIESAAFDMGEAG